MKERKLITDNELSKEKEKEVERMTKKIMSWAKKQGLSRVSVCYIGKECHIGKFDEDYISTTILDPKKNTLLDLALWR